MSVSDSSRAVVMVTSSYPRYPGDAIATFMEPIAHGVAARGREVSLVAPWHPEWRRAESEDGVHFHLFRYAPLVSMNVFGYASAMRSDVRLRTSAIVAAPFALAAGWRCTRRVVARTRASIVHAHWVIPGGVIGAAAAGRHPLVISLHGSDVYVAERHGLAGRAARAAFDHAAWVTACSSDLRDRAVALGASPDRMTVVPYGVDSERFRPDPAARSAGRQQLAIGDDVTLVFAYGRLVEKKGFEYLVDAAGILKKRGIPFHLAIAGSGDLDLALRTRARAAGVSDAVSWLGVVPQGAIPGLLAAADVVVAPSVHDLTGNVDGLPNTVLETMASATPLVTTPAGGIGTVATDGLTARIVPERDADVLADAIDQLSRNPSARAEIGRRARELVCRQYSWARVVDEFEKIYAHVERVPGKSVA